MRTLRTGVLTVGMAVLLGPTVAATEEPGQLTLEVSGLVGMEGLEVAASIASSPGPGHYRWEIPRAHQPIDVSPFSSELATFPVGAGTHEVVVVAGEPPCGAAYWSATCAESDPDYVCSSRLDVPPGEHLRLTIGGLPPYGSPPADLETSGIGPGCPVLEMRHEGLFPAE